jgi:hypothetical protein
MHIKTRVIKSSMSDHYAVYTELNYSIMSNNHHYVTFRDYKHFNENDFLYDMQCAMNSDSLYETDVNKVWNEFVYVFNGVCDKHAPIKTARLKNVKNPWITESIKSDMKRRDYLKSKAIKCKDQTIWDEYKVTRNKINCEIRRCKTQFFNSKLTSDRVNCHSFWQTIGKLVPNKKNTNQVPNELSADEFNNHFVNIGVNVTQNVGSNNDLPHFKHPECIYRFYFKDFNVDNICKRLLALGNQSSMDFIKMDAKLLSLSAPVISAFLTKLFNLSIRTGIIPCDWKIASVTPIYKGKGAKDNKSNYRPISITSHVMKILEHEILNQLMFYLKMYELITPDQSGFLKRHSTETCLHKVLTDWIDNMDNGLFTGVSFLDIEKCFDSINHKILLFKLDKYGIKHSWFQNYLTDRKQFVKLGNNLSSVQPVCAGVPQGSVLGPLLFILYANDISANVNIGTCNLYADDAIIYVTGNTLAETTKLLSNCLDDVSKWYNENKLSVNAKKSYSMLIHSIRKQIDDTNFNVNIGISKILNVTSTKYLGLILDSSINWQEHVLKTAAELRSKLSLLRRIAKFLSKSILSKIFLVYLQPRIEYCITVWGYSSLLNLRCMQRIQNTAARIICNEFDYVHTRSSDLLKQLNWMNVCQRRDFLLAKLMYKCLNGLAPNYLSDMFTFEKDLHNYETRNSQSMYLRIPAFKTEAFKSCILYQGPKIWNELPLSIKQSATLSSFHKNYLKSFKYKS